jgi:hypothetical protein
VSIVVIELPLGKVAEISVDDYCTVLDLLSSEIVYLSIEKE